MLYINDTDHIGRHPEQGYKGSLTKYFEIYHLVREHYGDIWHSNLKELSGLV